MPSATTSIMPVRMFSAHRLAWPSRRVVSANFTSLMVDRSDYLAAENAEVARYACPSATSRRGWGGVLFQLFLKPACINPAGTVFSIVNHTFQKRYERVDA